MPLITPKRFTIADYHRLREVGLLQEGDRVELIRGELIQMSPKGTAHSFCTMRLFRLLDRLLGEAVTLRCQEPIAIPPDSQPEPDIVLAQGRDTDYLDHHPYPADVLLAIEVADSSLEYDRTVKLALYAEAGIAHYWIADVNGRQMECYSQPYRSAQGYFAYQTRHIVLVDQPLTIPGFAAVTLDLQHIFP
ncbi:Uma2 family endonuclease [Alkalinema pantanalense CENA528]|uniref:Uma2 family endonuclease n=1 Tax=Alkalinema pantanalense TaxID=1620705 RepID=UPI003D6E48D7